MNIKKMLVLSSLLVCVSAQASSQEPLNNIAQTNPNQGINLISAPQRLIEAKPAMLLIAGRPYNLASLMIK